MLHYVQNIDISKWLSKWVHDLYSAEVLEESGSVDEDILGNLGSWKGVDWLKKMFYFKMFKCRF